MLTVGPVAQGAQLFLYCQAPALPEASPGAAAGWGRMSSSVCASSGLGSHRKVGMFVWGCILCACLGQTVGIGVKTGFELTQVKGNTGKGMRALVVNDLHV